MLMLSFPIGAEQPVTVYARLRGRRARRPSVRPWYSCKWMPLQPLGPLSGIRVLDLSSYLAGPYAGALLADLGAEVIKIEPPSGDALRQYPSTLPQESRAFLGVNRSKLGVVLDLKQPAGLSALLKLAAGSDVLLHNLRPRVPARLGIDYPSLHQLNPQLIYCALSGYGETGPLRDKAGYDQVLQAMTGICALQNETGGRPEIAYGSVVDYHGGGLLAFGIAAALFHRERTGVGQRIDLSLLAAALCMQSARFIWAEGEPREIGRDMRSGGVTGIHPAGEGDIYISANTPHFWQALCELTGLLELAGDARYDSVRKRNRQASEIVPKVRKALLKRTAMEWEAVFGDRVPCAAVRPIEDMFDHPQVLAEELVTVVKHPAVGRYRAIRKPLRFSETPGPEPFAAPSLGQHTDEVLKKYDKD
jgi:crotonobetainyl-CoA:carnitine CoA-transferase CaiB-like acyl-CoA transferase